MTKINIECQGLPCPQPVIKCKDAIESDSPNEISIVVDNSAAQENVTRFLENNGYTASFSVTDGEYLITGKKEINEQCEVMPVDEIAQVGNQKTLVFIAADTIGSGDDELGAKLMYNFILTLKEMGNELWRIVMVNGGVKLSTPENPCMDELIKLEEAGVSVLVCGTCLEHFALMDKRGVGEITNMLDIVTSMQLSSKTIRV